MKYEIKVIPGAKKNLVKEENGQWKVYLTAPAVDGKANKALISFLAEYWNVRKSRIEITKGLKSREKVVRISEL